MDYTLLFISLTIGTLHYVRIISTEEQSDAQDAIDLEKLYRLTFSNESIYTMAALEKNETYMFHSPGYPNENFTIISPGKKVYFHLYTRSNPEYAFRLEIDDVENLNRSPFNSAHKTKVLIHGWMNSISDSWIKNLTKYYLESADYNVIAVDWSILAYDRYSFSENYTRPAGEHTAKFLKYLNTAAKMSFSDVEISGRSLGVLVAAFTAADVSGGVDRINVTDSEGALYEITVSNISNDKSKSSGILFVDMFDTCTGLLGFLRVIGQVYFYPDEETCTQPECTSSRFTIVCETQSPTEMDLSHYNESSGRIMQTDSSEETVELFWADMWIKSC